MAMSRDSLTPKEQKIQDLTTEIHNCRIDLNRICSDEYKARTLLEKIDKLSKDLKKIS